MAGNLRLISDSRVRHMISRGPKCRFPSHSDFKKCREEIASTLNDFGHRWCKRVHVESHALTTWKVGIFGVVDTRVEFCSRGTYLLPPEPRSAFRHVQHGIQECRGKVCLGSSRQGRKQRFCCLTVILHSNFEAGAWWY